MKINQGMVHIAQRMARMEIRTEIQRKIETRHDPAILFVQYVYQGCSSTVPHPLVELLGTFARARPPRLLPTVENPSSSGYPAALWASTSSAQEVEAFLLVQALLVLMFGWGFC
jgi:hypothetical protein